MSIDIAKAKDMLAKLDGKPPYGKDNPSCGDGYYAYDIEDTFHMELHEIRQAVKQAENPSNHQRTDRKFRMQVAVDIPGEFIDDVMCTILESEAILYWCHKAEIVKPEEEFVYKHQVISHGGKIRFFIPDDKKWITLTRDKFLHGLKKYYMIKGVELDAGNIDGCAADIILQFALFGEQVYA